MVYGNGCNLGEVFQKKTSQTGVSALLAKTKNAAATGKFEKFKTDSRFDGTAKNPKWLGGMQES